MRRARAEEKARQGKNGRQELHFPLQSSPTVPPIPSQRMECSGEGQVVGEAGQGVGVAHNTMAHPPHVCVGKIVCSTQTCRCVQCVCSRINHHPSPTSILFSPGKAWREGSIRWEGGGGGGRENGTPPPAWDQWVRRREMFKGVLVTGWCCV